MTNSLQHSLVRFLFGLWAVGQLSLGPPPVEAQLNPNFYSKTCPTLYNIVMRVVQSAIKNETRNAASLLRLHFHDCFVNGCDASVLLDPTLTNPGEKSAPPNLNSLRAFDVVDSIKAAVEVSCPNAVSCADILTLASFSSIVLSGGPTWSVPLGRRDALAANATLTSNLPSPASDLPTLKQRFAIQKLTTTDLVALSGGHTIGLARCVVFSTRLYNFTGTGTPDPTLNTTLLASLRKSCPQSGDGNVINSLDLKTPTVFDNNYFVNLVAFKGLLNSDEVLFTTTKDTKDLVNLYAKNQTKFFADFSDSMIKMGNLNPLTGTAGEIRKNCKVRNSGTSTTSDHHETEEQVSKVGQIVGAWGVLESVIKKLIAAIAREEPEKLVEDTVNGLFASF